MVWFRHGDWDKPALSQETPLSKGSCAGLTSVQDMDNLPANLTHA